MKTLFCHIARRQIVAVVAALLQLAPSVATATEIKAGVYLNGKDAGQYREETREEPGQVTDIVEQLYVFERIGSRVEVSSRETYRQDSEGQLTGGHFETSSSKSSILMDIVVKAGTLEISTQSGEGRYTRNLPFDGELLGPHAVRNLLIRSAPPRLARYKTFVPTLGAIKEITVNCVARENIKSDGPSISTLKVEMSVEGIPGKTIMWVDESGRAVRVRQDSPFGPIEIARANYKTAPATNPTATGGTYENSESVSNIRLPHPRKLRAVTVELRKKPGAEPGWPAFSPENQHVSEKTADRIVIAMTQPAPDSGSPGPAKGEPGTEKPNALVQSDDAQIKSLAASVPAGETDPWKKALALQRWVAANMQFDTGIAVAPASELVRDRHGTCMGYATLLAALTRAAGIPSRIKLGYVYDSGMWGGHAWSEVLVNGRWLPLDAAEYFPGVADAARIGVITATGESGTIDNVGDLALLFGKIEIRVVSYSLGQEENKIQPQDKGYSVEGNTYVNRHLGLRVTKPNGATFKELEAHWPHRTVVTIEDAAGSAVILYGRANPDGSLPEQASALVKEMDSSLWRTARWNDAAAVRAQAPQKEAVVAQSGDALWAIVASGSDPGPLLERTLKATRISDF